MRLDRSISLLLALQLLGCSESVSISVETPPSDSVAPVLDLADVAAVSSGVIRVHGSTGYGGVGVPVAGGHDVDGDGEIDIAFAAMLASPLGRNRAGEIYLVFGNGQMSGTLDTAVDDPRILHILGTAPFENAGSEIWIDDVTGDGIADLLIAQQNFSPNPPDLTRIGTGALSIIVGGTELATQAASFAPIDLLAPPVAITVTTVLGAEQYDRLGIWVRTGDVTGDGIESVRSELDQSGHFRLEGLDSTDHVFSPLWAQEWIADLLKMTPMTRGSSNGSIPDRILVSFRTMLSLMWSKSGRIGFFIPLLIRPLSIPT